jgi:quercetin dioxygenase-like cupin family protein
MIALSCSVYVSMLVLLAGLVSANGNPDEHDPPGFVQVTPIDIKWLPNPAVPGSQVAILFGNPQDAGPLAIRVKFPPGAKVMPHTHGEPRTYTVLAGEWKLGFGVKFDIARLRSFPPGSNYRLPANVPHFQATGDVETIVQIESVAPSSTDFINPLDDLRKKR